MPEKLSSTLIEKMTSLARGTSGDLSAYIQEVVSKEIVDGTKTEAHFYHLKFDGNGRPKVKPFTDAIANYALEYAIPRQELEQACPTKHAGSYAEMVRLGKVAQSLFTNLANSGEGGEILLFALAERILGLPQLVCKMSLKTSSKMHFHGADGVHVGTNEKGNLALYWGESKVHKSANDALTECFKSLEDFIHADSFISGHAANDFQLIFKNPSLPKDDEELRAAILSYFDQSGQNAFGFETRAICLIGFDETKYLEENMDDDAICALLKSKVQGWKKSLSTKAAASELEKFVMYAFILPFPSVEEFRGYMLESLGVK